MINLRVYKLMKHLKYILVTFSSMQFSMCLQDSCHFWRNGGEWSDSCVQLSTIIALLNNTYYVYIIYALQ